MLLLLLPLLLLSLLPLLLVILTVEDDEASLLTAAMVLLLAVLWALSMASSLWHGRLGRLGLWLCCGCFLGDVDDEDFDTETEVGIEADVDGACSPRCWCSWS